MHHYHFRLVGIDFEEDVRGRNAGGNEELKACTMALLTDCITLHKHLTTFLFHLSVGTHVDVPNQKIKFGVDDIPVLDLAREKKKIGWEVKNIPLNVLFGAKYLSCNHNSLKCWHQINMEP